jgi:hypothetical protein
MADEDAPTEGPAEVGDEGEGYRSGDPSGVEGSKGIEKQAPLETMFPATRNEPSGDGRKEHGGGGRSFPMPFLLLDRDASRLE